METTAAIPKIIDAMKSSKRFPLALPSRQAIFRIQPKPAFETIGWPVTMQL